MTFYDTPASARFPIYTRSNAGEVLPDPVSPLGWTLVWAGAILDGWRDGDIRVGQFAEDELAGDYSPVAGLFNGYFYINATIVRVFGERSGAGSAAIDAAFFGNRADTPPHVAHPDDMSDEATARIGEVTGWAMSVTDLPDLRDDRDRAAATRAARPDLLTLSDAALIERARSFLPEIRWLFNQHARVSGLTAIGPTIVGMTVGAIDPSLVMRTVSGTGDVDSALPGQAMWDLSRTVRASSVLTEIFDGGADGLMDRLTAEPDAGAFLAAFDEFLVTFGSRGPNEWDIGVEVWETKPSLALSLIDRMRQSTDVDDPRARLQTLIDDRAVATAEAHAALAGSPEALGMFMAGQQSALVFLAARERAKTTIIKVIHEVRMSLRELGRRMQADGLIDSVSDVFLIHVNELDAFAVDPGSFVGLINERRALMADLRTREPHYFVDGTQPVPGLDTLPRKADRHVSLAAAGDVLQGAPGCNGIARGRARVILDSADPLALEPGDVLIAPVTDPSWTPLFVPAAAVVVDVGAMNSHAIIVSREMGIPCVVSLTDATRMIPDGAMVEVNGMTGTVTLL
jgi:rifampicin phosphotransferase